MILACRDVAQLGRALRSGRRGRWFESSHPDQIRLLAENSSARAPPESNAYCAHLPNDSVSSVSILSRFSFCKSLLQIAYSLEFPRPRSDLGPTYDLDM